MLTLNYNYSYKNILVTYYIGVKSGLNAVEYFRNMEACKLSEAYQRRYSQKLETNREADIPKNIVPNRIFNFWKSRVLRALTRTHPQGGF